MSNQLAVIARNIVTLRRIRRVTAAHSFFTHPIDAKYRAIERRGTLVYGLSSKLFQH